MVGNSPDFMRKWYNYTMYNIDVIVFTALSLVKVCPLETARKSKQDL